MQRQLSLRARLIASFVAIIIGALALAGIAGVVRFDAMMDAQAQNTSETSMNVASGLLDDEIRQVHESVRELAADNVTGDGSGIALSSALSQSADIAGLSYVAFVTADGTVAATSRGSQPYVTEWEQLRGWAGLTEPMSGLTVVPEPELETLGFAEGLFMQAKETPNGTVVPGEERGALSVVAIEPVDGGVLVGVRVLKLNHQLVDSVVAKMGGTSTLFQGGVRVSTTVKNEKGQRALGTVVSDEVRKTALEKGEPFGGEAFVVNREYITNYLPLRDVDKAVVGMLYVGVDQAPYAAATRTFALTFGGVIALALGLALFGAFNVSRALTRPLGSVSEAAALVATGDLTAQVPAEGYREVRELGRSFNTMTSGLQTIIVQVDASVQQLRAVAGQISAASKASSGHASSQASAVVQTTATLEELTRSFQQVSDGARRVLHMAEDALESAQGGVSTVERAHDAMDQLAAGANDMSVAAGAMNSVTREITEMTTIITGIASQTKILALNAAIEAARAGEAGRGFAVVSSEIRSLAESVAESAARIDEMVSGIQDASSRFQQAAQRQSTLSEATVESRQESSDAFRQIVQQMEDTALAAREIAEATVHQTRASDQLVDAMQQVSRSSTETAVAAEQLAESATSVEGEAEHLRQSLTRFKTR